MDEFETEFLTIEELCKGNDANSSTSSSEGEAEAAHQEKKAVPALALSEHPLNPALRARSPLTSPRPEYASDDDELTSSGVGHFYLGSGATGSGEAAAHQRRRSTFIMPDASLLPTSELFLSDSVRLSSHSSLEGAVVAGCSGDNLSEASGPSEATSPPGRPQFVGRTSTGTSISFIQTRGVLASQRELASPRASDMESARTESTADSSAIQAVLQRLRRGSTSSLTLNSVIAARSGLEDIGGLKVPPHTVSVDLHSNKLANVDALFAENGPASEAMLSVQILHLSGNRIVSVPPEIASMRNLVDLDLSFNSLEALPDAIGALTALRSLNLSCNLLSALPDSIGTLTALERLSLLSNRLTGPLPDALANLSWLTDLVLSGNSSLSHLSSPSLLGLQSLKLLHLWGCLANSARPVPLAEPESPRLDADLPSGSTASSGSGSGSGVLPIVEVLSCVSRLVTLVDLDLRCNDIEELPDALCGLASLERLSLAKNKLRHLPRDISRLTSLEVLDVAHNHLVVLPPQLARMPALTFLLVVGNPLESPRRDVVLRGTQEMLTYFNDILPGKYFDQFVVDCMTRACVVSRSRAVQLEANVDGLRAVLLSYPPALVLRHKEQVLSSIKAKMVSSETQLAVDTRMHLLLLACSSSQVLLHCIDHLDKIALETPGLLLNQDGTRIMSQLLGTTTDAAVARRVAGILCRVAVGASKEDQRAICTLGSRVFARHVPALVQGNMRLLSAVLDMASSGWIEVHRRLRVRDVVFQELIGSGASARVYKGTYEGEDVAIKQFDVEMIEECDYRREVALLSLLHNPHVLGCLGASLRHGFVVMRHYELGNLYSLLHTPSGAKTLSIALGHSGEPRSGAMLLSLRRKLNMLSTIASALEYVHSMGIIHRDLKSENILVSRSLAVCVADLGISRVVAAEMTQAMGTPRYMAPEVLGGKPYGIEADVYSFGVLAWEIMSEELPYSKMTSSWEVAGAVTNGQRPTISSTFPQSIARIITACWAPDPSTRPPMRVVASRLYKIIGAVAQHGRPTISDDMSPLEEAVVSATVLTRALST